MHLHNMSQQCEYILFKHIGMRHSSQEKIEMLIDSEIDLVP